MDGPSLRSGSGRGGGEARRVGGCNKQCWPPGASHAAVAAASDMEEEGKKMSLWTASSGKVGWTPHLKVKGERAGLGVQ